MKKLKYPLLKGYILFYCTGKDMEKLFNLCLKNNIKLWWIKSIRKDEYKITVEKRDLKSFQTLCEDCGIQYKALEKRGLAFNILNLLRKREILLASLLSFSLLFLLSNIIWSVQVEGLPEELEHRVYQKVKTYGIEKGRLTFNLPEASIIQQQLINDLPELLWIGVEKKGTSIVFKGVEKLSITKDHPKQARDLVANKDAIIKDIFVIEGLAVIKRNDFVRENDLLISGMIKNEENDEATLVAAQGDVIGETWYEVKVTIPLKETYEKLTGRSFKQNNLQLFSLKLPVHFKKKESYEDYLTLKEFIPIRFLLWDTPLKIQKNTVYEIIEEENNLRKEEAIKKGKKAAIQSLNHSLGHNFKVKTNKVLQEREENGKVNLILFLAIEENIVKSRPIIQGD